MDDKLATIVPKITRLLLIALGNGSTDGERVNAIHLVQQQLKDADSDSHDLLSGSKLRRLAKRKCERSSTPVSSAAATKKSRTRVVTLSP